MAHRIYKYDKQQGLVQAWHGLTEIKPTITIDDNWLRTWDVVPVILDKRGKQSKWTVLECSDVPELEIGQPYNSETFKPVDNKSFLELVRASIAGTTHEIVSVGSVRNRGRVFLSLKLSGMEQFKSGGRDFSAYLNFGNGHDKSSVLWVNTSNICTVCDNTFSCNLFSVENKATAEKENTDDIRIRQRHTKNVIMRLPEMAKLIDKAVGVQAEFQLAFEELSKTSLSVPTARNLFAGFIGRKTVDKSKGLSTRASNTVTRLVDLFQSGPGNTGKNRADAFSAVTDYYTHYSSGGTDNSMRQFLSSEYGSGQQSKADFWDLITDDEEDKNPFDVAVDLGEELLTNTAA